jgi:hypothetical protein
LRASTETASTWSTGSSGAGVALGLALLLGAPVGVPVGELTEAEADGSTAEELGAIALTTGCGVC